jgi:Repeat of unknown function (DUF5907)
MAALDFPASPTVGQQYAAPNGITYQWDGAAWVVTGGVPATPTGPAGGDLAGSTYPNPVIAAGAVTAAKIAAGVIPTTLPPSGAAGGDLAGSTYPNPTIAAAAVTRAKLAVNATNQAVSQNLPPSFASGTLNTWIGIVTTPSLVTRGGRVLIFALIGGQVSATAAGGTIYFGVYRNGSIIYQVRFDIKAPANATSAILPPPPFIFYSDQPAAGSYQYSLYVYQGTNTLFTGAADSGGTLWAMELS